MLCYESQLPQLPQLPPQQRPPQRLLQLSNHLLEPLQSAQFWPLLYIFELSIHFTQFTVFLIFIRNFYDFWAAFFWAGFLPPFFLPPPPAAFFFGAAFFFSTLPSFTPWRIFYIFWEFSRNLASLKKFSIIFALLDRAY